MLKTLGLYQRSSADRWWIWPKPAAPRTRCQPGGELCGETIRNWGRQADLGEGPRHDGLTTEKKQEGEYLRREKPVASHRAGDSQKRTATEFARVADSTSSEGSSS